MNGFSRYKAVLDALAQPDFAPKSCRQIASDCGLTYTKTRRVLKDLEAHGWTRYDRERELWKIDASLVQFSIAYERYFQQQREQHDREHMRMTGEAPEERDT